MNNCGFQEGSCAILEICRHPRLCLSPERSFEAAILNQETWPSWPLSALEWRPKRRCCNGEHSLAWNFEFTIVAIRTADAIPARWILQPYSRYQTFRARNGRFGRLPANAIVMPARACFS